jgi:hypothetical protein
MAENKLKFMVKKGMVKGAFSWVALMFLAGTVGPVYSEESECQRPKPL